MSLIETGIINVLKPQDFTSHDCVAIMRGVLGLKRVGHTGTLDPMATGVLPVCAGPAARVMEYLDLDFKTYECEMQLGLTSDTLDIWGEVEQAGDASAVTEEQIREAFVPFKGMISQVPPKYSAIKIDGRKLYQYARSGEDVDIPTREVYINDIEIISIDMKEKKILWRVECSKGTYIRSICRDIGDALGCGAVMTGLTRTASGAFTIENAVDIRQLRDM
ncbi:MAG: tRNA pseudouridine(55) synthase TruB, partial [Firmicutes bacterium]|nr:tRNA pseudouridine(55) synthase TruB [Bacillota bacterium]